MRTPAVLLSLAMLSTAAVPEPAGPIQLQDNRAVVQVQGVVCSFCAYGTEKNLGKLDFLDQSEYGGDGVLLDIHTHRITLALDPAKPVDLPAVHKAILDGGYDPVSAFVRIRGRVETRDDRVILTGSANGQSWRLEGRDFKTPVAGQEMIVEGRIAAADFAHAPTGLIPVTVTKVEEPQ